MVFMMGFAPVGVETLLTQGSTFVVWRVRSFVGWLVTERVQKGRIAHQIEFFQRVWVTCEYS